MDCSYHGYVAGFPNSLVSLHTCSGLRGTLQLKNISYGIEPMEAVSGFVHMIYEEKYDNTSVPLLGETKTYSYNNTYYHIRKSSERTEFFKLRPQYVEIYIVVDKNLNCTHKDCCDPRICVKKKGKQCGSGECCTLDCKYCLRFVCVEVQYQIRNEECNSTYCNSHGVCNNLNHCHCEKGFAPPTCMKKKGEFGSIDDGHKAPSGKSYLREQNTTPSKHRFLLIFYISLPVLIITAIVLIKQNKIRELCYRDETESERSVSEESSSNSKLSPSVR
nr:disintegrin and metalloproteinase domain-containing protein 5-like [Mirounga angustirostris]